MSAATARAQRVGRPAPDVAPKSPAPRLRLVRPPQQNRTRVPFVLACMSVLVVALLGALLLNTSMAQMAFATTAAQRELARVEQDTADLQAEIDAQSSPEQLAVKARALGMVPASGIGWLRLSDGTVSGSPSPAAG